MVYMCAVWYLFVSVVECRERYTVRTRHRCSVLYDVWYTIIYILYVCIFVGMMVSYQPLFMHIYIYT